MLRLLFLHRPWRLEKHGSEASQAASRASKRAFIAKVGNILYRRKIGQAEEEEKREREDVSQSVTWRGERSGRGRMTHKTMRFRL